MKPKARKVLEQAVEAGVRLGIRRAYKNGDPDAEQLQTEIEVAVMNEIDEWFDFDREDAT